MRMAFLIQKNIFPTDETVTALWTKVRIYTSLAVQIVESYECDLVTEAGIKSRLFRIYLTLSDTLA